MNRETEIEELAPWLAALITLIGGALRLLLLGSKGMWLDETFSVWLANHSVVEMLQWIVKADQHPPLYYLLLHYWVALQGDTPYAVRLLSALLGTGTIPVIYLIGKRMSGAAMGLAAAVFLALSPFHIRFAQEARMYTCVTFSAAVALYALVRLLTDSRSDRPIGSQFRDFWRAWRTPGPAEEDSDGPPGHGQGAGRRARWRAWASRRHWLPIQTVETDLAWVAFVVFSAATMLSHNAAILFPLAANAFVVGLMVVRSKKPGLAPAFQAPSPWNWAKAQVGILLLWSPWLVPFVKQAGRIDVEFWLPRPTWDTVIRALQSFLNDAARGLPAQAQVIWIVYALVLFLGLWHFRSRMSHFVFLAALFAIPFLGELIVSLRRPIFSDRTLIWATVPLLLVLAAGIAQLRFRVLIIAVVGLLGTVNLFSAGDYYRFVQKEDWSTAAAYVANFAQSDDLILFNAASVQIPFDYYFRAYEEQYSIRVERQGVPGDLLDRGILEPKMTENDVPALISMLSGRKRVWLVYSHSWYTDPLGLIPRTLAAQMVLVRQRDFYGGQVQLYEAP